MLWVSKWPGGLHSPDTPDFQNGNPVAGNPVVGNPVADHRNDALDWCF